jgi:4-hydroxybenzoate polyprenyltransferase
VAVQPVSKRSEEPSPATAVCVDLDGTLIRTDTLHESILLLLRSNPSALLSCLLILFRRGIAAFKRSIASQVTLRADLLPFNYDLIDYLRDQATRGRRLLLVTAADSLIANAVAHHLGFFDLVLASDGLVNLKANTKLDRIRRTLNDQPFEYAGDSPADIPVWKAASAAILVNPTRMVKRAVNRSGVAVTKEFHRGGRLGALARALRVYQWSKNLLVFAPLFLSHNLFNWTKLAITAQAFAAFCAAASAIYVINDLLDLESDRRHIRKRYRPFASGTLSVAQGAALSAALLGISGIAALRLPRLAQMLLVLYLLVNLAYSTVIKAELFLDVTTLAALYTVRLLFGGVVADIVISPWTLAFSIFLFTSLAICKRLSELRCAAAPGDAPLPGRAYSQTDLAPMTALAASSGYVAILVLALYLNSPEVVILYKHPRVMWFLLPVMAYWISRAIIIANRGEMHDDPIVFAFSDRASQLSGLAALAVVLGGFL